VLLQARVAAQLTQEELAARAKVAARTISDLERGKAKIPHADTVLRLARALQLTGPAMATFEAAARRRVMQPNDAADISRSSIAIPETATHLYRVRRGQASVDNRRIGIITGSIRHVRDADIGVNSENTDMQMSRFEEYTISAIIRYDGARRDSAGRCSRLPDRDVRIPPRHRVVSGPHLRRAGGVPRSPDRQSAFLAIVRTRLAAGTGARR
jgi:transcriptional regulator with XRE-family HTH domain